MRDEILKTLMSGALLLAAAAPALAQAVVETSPGARPAIWEGRSTLEVLAYALLTAIVAGVVWWLVRRLRRRARRARGP